MSMIGIDSENLKLAYQVGVIIYGYFLLSEYFVKNSNQKDWEYRGYEQQFKGLHQQNLD